MLDHSDNSYETVESVGLYFPASDEIEFVRGTPELEATFEKLEIAVEEVAKQESSEQASEQEDKIVCPPFSLIIPVYNEEDAIDETIIELRKTFGSLKNRFEIIVVNDGSSDATAERLAKWDGITVINHERNCGYGASLKTGIRHSEFDWIVITDADGSYPNHRIPELLSKAQHFDMVVGARTGANVTYSKLRSIPKWFLVRFAQWMAQRKIPDLNSGLRVFRKDVAMKFIKLYPDGFSFTTTITMAMLTNRYRVHYEPVDYHVRVGNSKIQPVRDTLRFTQLILRMGMYFAPMRVVLPISLLFFAGFLGSAFQDVFIRKDLTEATLILLVSATQLGVFALLADMIDKRSN